MNNKIGEKYLPIGTVVLLKDAKKRTMITGFVAKEADGGDKMYDYIGCLYPEGVLSSSQNLLFNHEQIDQIYYMGYSDKEEVEFKNQLKTLLQQQNKG